MYPVALIAGNLSCFMISQEVQAEFGVREVKLGDEPAAQHSILQQSTLSPQLQASPLQPPRHLSHHRHVYKFIVITVSRTEMMSARCSVTRIKNHAAGRHAGAPHANDASVEVQGALWVFDAVHGLHCKSDYQNTLICNIGIIAIREEAGYAQEQRGGALVGR